MKFKSFFCVVLVLLSCTSMQGIKFYLKWGKNKFEITKKVVEETEKLKDLFEYFGDLDKEDEDYNKVFDNDGNFIFNMKDIAKKILLPNEGKLADEMVKNDVKKLAEFLGKPEEFSFEEYQDFVVICNFSFYLNNEKALKVCYKNFQDDMTDEKLLGFLEGKGGFLAYVIGQNVIPRDFLMEAWRRYAKGITNPFKEVKEIEIYFNKYCVGWDEEKKGFYIARRVRPDYWSGKDLYDKRYYPFSDKDLIPIKKDSYEKLKEDGLVGSKVDQEIHFGMYFWQINPGSLKLFHSGDKEKPLKIYNIKKVFSDKVCGFHSIEKVFVSPRGSKLLVFMKSMTTFSIQSKYGNKFDALTSVIYIELNTAGDKFLYVFEDKFLYGDDFAENVVVRGLRLYKQKNKKLFMYNPYNKRIKLLSEEMVEQLFDDGLLRKPDRKEARRMKIEGKFSDI